MGATAGHDAVDDMSAFPRYVDLEPFDPCNLKCPFCFGPDFISEPHKSKPLSFWRAVVRDLRTRGVAGVVVSGGEPTLYRGQEGGAAYSIVELLESARAAGLRVTLSSNTTRPNVLREAAVHIDWLAIPIDSATIDGQMAMRGFARPLAEWESLIASLRGVNGDLAIKLGTVATQLNQDDVVELGTQIAQGKLSVDTWKVYQYHPRRMTLTRGRVDELRISNEAFAALGRRVGAEVGPLPRETSLVWSSINDRNSAYLFVYSDGRVAIPNLDPEPDLIIGTLREGDFAALDRVEEVVSTRSRLKSSFEPANTRNYTGTYGEGESL